MDNFVTEDQRRKYILALQKQKRLYRKSYLDNKKARAISTTVIGQSSSSCQTKNSSKSVIYDRSNYSIMSNHHTYYASYKENFNRQQGNYHQQSTFHSPSDNTIQRYPLSNISNVLSNVSYNCRTPLSNNNVNSRKSIDVSSNISSTIIQGSTSTQPTRGRPRKKRIIENLSPIPFVDITLLGENIHEINPHPTHKGISKEYVDNGDQNVICQLCNAKLWRDESIRGKARENKSFSLCCGYGKVLLPEYTKPPIPYENLFRNLDSKSKNFTKNIRSYNSMFSFTSMGGKVDSSINRGNAPYILRISGQNCHSMGSLLPLPGVKPKFSQLYIYDTENEISNRQQCVGSTKQDSTGNGFSTDIIIIRYLKQMLDSNNQLVKMYRMVRDCFEAYPQLNLKLRLIGKRDKDGRTYNLPTCSEVAALIVGDIGDLIDNRDIIVETSTGILQRLSELHPSYLPLQYPLLFPYGEDGYRVDIPHRGVTPTNYTKRQNCTMREFFAYRIQDKVDCFLLILNSRRLFQQFLGDGYTMIEAERLFYIRKQQTKLRCDTFENLKKIQNEGNSVSSNIGQRVVLPSSFTGGARYMMQNYLDVMSLCKWYGYPDYFITFTCNPKWPEVKRFLQDTTLQAEDRPDVVCRLFKIKLDAFIKDLKDNLIFGKIQAVVYTIEFQKRGLPHSHICLFMHSDHKLQTVEHIDPVISAEIPNNEEDPELYCLVKELMIHGPCGPEHLNSPCMVEKKCSKKFPKKFHEETSIDAKGYAQYRRRNKGNFVEKNKVKLDNRYVIPYNKTLLKKYQAHINVEWCNQVGSIKYLFKYINKGPDRATVAVVQNDEEGDKENDVDEIKQYYDCRYLSACEASWRIFGYDVHYRIPSVMRLPFHLPGQQSVVYGDEDDIDYVLDKPSVASSKILNWIICNEKYPEARNLTYVEFPTKFVWKCDKRCWEPRKRNFSIGRIHSVSPTLGEAYFLRILLNKVKGPRCFEEIRTVNGHIHSSFRDACYALGLLDDDNEYIEAIKEAFETSSGYYIRSLFAMMLLNNTLSRPDFVWNKTWQYLSEDILYNQQRRLQNPDISIDDEQLKNLTLFEIEKLLNRNNSSLNMFNQMPYPNHASLATVNNRHIMEELDYDRDTMNAEFQNLLESLTTEQRDVFDQIMQSAGNKTGGVFFVYGYGGTGKTFLWKTLSAAIRSSGNIVLNVASSGIASLLLTGGRTAHSRFGIPINLTEDSVCYTTPNSEVGCLLKNTKLIIWDEAPMTHKHAFEALDRCLKDIMKADDSRNAKILFGGKTIVFGGDFRQVLPAIPNGSRQDIVNASLCSSHIWSECKVLKLTKNMRLTIGSDSSDHEETMIFAQWLLNIGEGKLGGPNDGDAVIDIPEDILITTTDDPLSSLFDFVYPSILENYNLDNYFQDRAILAPTNEIVSEINDRFLSIFPGEEKEYLSSDSLCATEDLDNQFDPSLYSPDVLNGLKISGLPHHRLVLKVGVPIMLLRNIDQKMCLCNGTRLKVFALGKRVIEAEIISGGNIGYRAFIPRIALSPSDIKIPFKFQRRQFPIAVCFSMTINKSQGQSLSKVGLFLRQPVFSHGQLYVALSRVKSRKGLKILILDNDKNVCNKTRNVVFKEIFSNL